MEKRKKLFYHKVVPKFIREPLRHHDIRKSILQYYDNLPEGLINEEEKAVIDYLKNNRLSVFPYSFQENYKSKNMKVYRDKKLKLKYILFDGKKLYFRRKSSKRGVKRGFHYLQVEQDINSPHRYLTDKFNIKNDDILVDVGAAEGNLALSVIDKVKKVYLFETDENWIEALEATFAPWREKVEIINKFVSDRNDEKTVSLDQFFQDKEKFTFLKIDAEGAEASILMGCNTLLSSDTALKIAVCSYHKPQDGQYLREFLKKKGFSTSFSKGYMIFNDPEFTLSPPYLRKGVIRAEKKI